MRITHRRRDDGAREYDVLTQDEPRGRRHEGGRVSGLGQPPSWIALGTAAEAWTAWHAIRRAAKADMLAGHTFLAGARQDPEAGG